MVRTRWTHIFVMALMMVVGGSVIASAVPIDTFIDGDWLEFRFAQANTFAFQCSAVGCTPSAAGNSEFLGARPWTFTNTDPVLLVLTDAFQHGDAFQPFDFGVAVGGPTPAVVADNVGSGPDPTDPAFTSLDPLYSHASYLFAPGDHSITIRVNTSPYGGGAAYFRLITQAVSVPEPGTLLLMGAGLTALALKRRRSA
jgi:hypothetical protein